MAKTKQELFNTRANRNIESVPKSIIKTDKKESFPFGKPMVRYVSRLVDYKALGLAEEIFGIKSLKSGTYYQKIAVIPEDQSLTPVARNCWLGWGCSAGFHTNCYTPKEKKSPSYETKMVEVRREFLEHCYRTELFTVEDIIALDPSLIYCAYKENRFISAIDYIALYRQYPIAAEMLMKLGLPRLVTKQALKRLTEDKAFRKYIGKNAGTFGNLAYSTIAASYKTNSDPREYQQKTADKLQLAREMADFFSKENRETINRNGGYEKLKNYLEKNDLTGHERSYNDYLTACAWLKLDFADTKVMYPKNFWTMHNQYTTSFGEWQKEENARIEAERKAEAERQAIVYTRGMAVTAEEFAFLENRSSEFSILIAKSTKELIAEGSELSHCVGSFSYNKKQADRESIICFVRHSGDIGTPFVTAEIGIGKNELTLRQLYGFKDSIAPDDVKEYVTSWLKESNEIYAQHRKNVA